MVEMCVYITIEKEKKTHCRYKCPNHSVRALITYLISLQCFRKKIICKIFGNIDRQHSAFDFLLMI